MFILLGTLYEEAVAEFGRTRMVVAHILNGHGGSNPSRFTKTSSGRSLARF